MSNPNLTRTQVIDKNGKPTHVHKNLSGHIGSSRGVTVTPTSASKGSAVYGGLSEDDFGRISELIFAIAPVERIPDDEMDGISDCVAEYVGVVVNGQESIVDNFYYNLGKHWSDENNADLYALNDILTDMTAGSGIGDEDLNNLTHEVARVIDNEIDRRYIPEFTKYESLGDAALAARSVDIGSPILKSRVNSLRDIVSTENQLEVRMGTSEKLDDEEIEEQAVTDARHELFFQTMKSFADAYDEIDGGTHDPAKFYSEAASLIIGHEYSEFGEGEGQRSRSESVRKFIAFNNLSDN